MRYLDFLAQLHDRLAAPPYLEIGIRNGDSLALARGPAVGIDPGFNLHVELSERVALFDETSDEYFDRPDPLAPLDGRRIGLAFIDGMHLSEFALRDFINVERHAAWSSVVVFDDILPRRPDEAARERSTRAWTGDVYKLLGTLARHRPDLCCLRVGTAPTGLLLVLGLDPGSRQLARRYDAIVRELVVPDPQDVPAEILERRGVLDSQAVLDAPLWPLLAGASHNQLATRLGRVRLRQQVAALSAGARRPAPHVPA